MFDNYNNMMDQGNNQFQTRDYSAVHGDGSGVNPMSFNGGAIGGILGKMTDQKGIFQGGQKNRMFGRLRDAWEGTDSNDPTSSNYQTTATNINTGNDESFEVNDIDPDNIQPGQNRFANSNDKNLSGEREYPSWHPLHPNNAASEGDVNNDVVKPGQNIFGNNEENDGTNGVVQPGQNIFNRGLGEDTEEGDGSSVFDYNKPQYNKTSYAEPEHNNSPFNRQSGKNSNYPYDNNVNQSLLSQIPGYNTVSNWSNYANTNPSKVDAELDDNQTNVFNSTRGNKLGGY